MNENTPKPTAERLPGYDRKTRRWEWVVFLILGKVVFALIALAVFDATKFAAGKERIVAALSTGPRAVAHKASGPQAKVALAKPTAFEPQTPVANPQPDCCASGERSLRVRPQPPSASFARDTVSRVVVSA
jgi:nitrate reductase NapE component